MAPSNRSRKDFLLYWQPAEMEDAGEPILHAASEQFGRARPGDTLWIVTAPKGNLQLLGRLAISKILDHRSAVRHFRNPELRKASLHAIAKRAGAVAMRATPIGSIAHRLRFKSGQRPRLAVMDGRVAAQQLQTMRELTAKSAKLLADTWTSASLPANTPGDSGALSAADVPARALVGLEGSPRLRVHVARERNAAIVKLKRQATRAASRGRLPCEVCGFDFGSTYGERGDGFCEVHHLVPLGESETERETRVEDLAVVCSNCHRMIHRQEPFLSLQVLRRLIKPRRASDSKPRARGPDS